MLHIELHVGEHSEQTITFLEYLRLFFKHLSIVHVRITNCFKSAQLDSSLGFSEGHLRFSLATKSRLFHIQDTLLVSHVEIVIGW